MTNLDVFKHFNLNKIINASGTMTSIGASRLSMNNRQMVDQILDSFVSIDQLQNRASEIISKITLSEAGCITSCSASAITQAVAACITGNDIAAIEQLPYSENKISDVILPMGHTINYGAPIDQAIRLAGAEVNIIGTAAQCEVHHLKNALKAGAIAAVYVVSHHTVRENELPMDIFIEICNEYNVPTIIDMASEYDLQTPIKLGASIVIYSGHKFLSGATSGIAAGKKHLINDLYLQNKGIGRTMKVGKEGIVSAMVAMEEWLKRDHEFERKKELSIIELWKQKLSNLNGIEVFCHDDWTGNPITRLKLKVNPTKTLFYAWELAESLANRSPRIIVRDDLIESQEIYLDPCNIRENEADMVSTAIIEEYKKLSQNNMGLKICWSEIKRARDLKNKT